MNKLRYGVIGFGAVGRVIAAHLLAADYQVSVLAHGSKKAKEICSNPLLIQGEVNITTQVNECYSSLSEFLESEPDVLLICTKNTDSKALLEQINELNPNKNMLFVSCQNGIDVENQISEIFGRKRALRLVLNMGCNLTATNSVTINFFMPHYLSDLPLGAAKAQQIADDFSNSGFTTLVKTDYRVETFKKALLNSSLGSLCAVTRKTMSRVMAQDDMRCLVKQIVEEGMAVAHAMDIAIASDFAEQAMLYLDKGGDHKPSMLMDIENQKKTENDYHCGKLAEYAQACGLKLKLIPVISALIKTIESE